MCSDIRVAGIHRKSLTPLTGRKGSTNPSEASPSHSLSQEGAKLSYKVDVPLTCALSSSTVSSVGWEESLGS